MKRFRCRYISLPLVGSLLLPSWSALAEGAPPTVPERQDVETPAPPASAPDAESAETVTPAPVASPAPNAAVAHGPIFVAVSVTGYAVQAADIAAAIARELNVALSSVPELARSSFDVVVVKDQDLALTFRDHAGNELKRVVKAPASDAQVSEVAALLAVNLSQDKSAELIAQLTPAPTPTEPTKPPPLPPSAEIAPTAKPSAPTLPFVFANATVVYPMTVVRDVEERSVGFELGLFYSRVGAVSGVAINPLMLHVRQSTGGVLVAGLGTISGNDEYTTPQDTARVAGLFNYGMGPFRGVGIAGLADIENVPEGIDRGLLGAQVSGLVSGVNANVEGTQIAGLANYSRELLGVQVGGLLNVARGPADGGQISGAVNFAEGLSGAQIGALGNIATQRLSGVQISGGANIAPDVDGAQIGIVNIGGHVNGVQIGIVNVADEVDGASIGVVTYSKKGQTQLTTWFDSTRPVNVGARFVSGALYAMPMLGGDPTKGDEFAFGFSLGARVPVDRLYFDLEGNSSNEVKDGKVDESAIDLRYRAAVGFQVTPWLGVFAGGGVRHQFHAANGGEHRLRGIWNVGVDIF